MPLFSPRASDNEGNPKVEHKTQSDQWGWDILFPNSTSIIYRDEPITQVLPDRINGPPPRSLVCALGEVGSPDEQIAVIYKIETGRGAPPVQPGFGANPEAAES